MIYVALVERLKLLKVGYSDNLPTRVVELAVAAKSPVTVVAAMPGTLADERALHARLAADARRKPETRRAAADVLTALQLLDVRAYLDGGLATHEARQGDTSDVVATLGPAPEAVGS